MEQGKELTFRYYGSEDSVYPETVGYAVCSISDGMIFYYVTCTLYCYYPHFILTVIGSRILLQWKSGRYQVFGSSEGSVVF